MRLIKRLNFIYFLFWFLFVSVFLRIGYIQLIKASEYKNFASGQYYKILPFKGKRGRIMDRLGRELAVSLKFYSVYVDPMFVKDVDILASQLSSVVSISENEIKRRVLAAKRFVWIVRKISWQEKEKIKALKLNGLFFREEDKRFYPEGRLASAVLGFVNVDNYGIEGIEYFYDKYLRGKNGTVKVLSDSSSRELVLTPNILAPQKGRTLTLEIDSRVQMWTELFLEETIKEYNARAGGVVVMNALTGEVYALANYPYFDPNKSVFTNNGSSRNKVVADFFEPGSVFKIVTLMAAVDNKLFDNNDIIFCENGKYKVPGTLLHDYHAYGNLKFKEVFMRSSNIGVAKIANKLGKERLYEYIKKLGFGELTGIDLPGETRGMVSDVNRWSKTSPYIIPMGQEIGISLVQLVRACAVAANGGYLVTPCVVRKVEGIGRVGNNKNIRSRVISNEAANRVYDILVDVVNGGTGKRARIEGVVIGGKTGTAQKYDPKIGRYSPNKYRANFVGFIGSLKEPVVIAVTVDEPRKSHFGGVVAAPLFRKIAEKVLVYYGEGNEGKK